MHDFVFFYVVLLFCLFLFYYQKNYDIIFLKIKIRDNRVLWGIGI